MSHDSEKGPRQEREHPEGWQEAGGCKCVGLTWARLSVPGPRHSPAGNVGEQGMDSGDRMGERFPPRSCWVWLRTRHPLEAPTGCNSPHPVYPTLPQNAVLPAREEDMGTQWQCDRDIPRPGVKLMPQFPPSLTQCGAGGGHKCGPGFPQGCSFNPFFSPKRCSRESGHVPVTSQGESVSLPHPSPCHEHRDQLWVTSLGYTEIKIIRTLLTYQKLYENTTCEGMGVTVTPP